MLFPSPQNVVNRLRNIRLLSRSAGDGSLRDMGGLGDSGGDLANLQMPSELPLHYGGLTMSLTGPGPKCGADGHLAQSILIVSTAACKNKVVVGERSKAGKRLAQRAFITISDVGNAILVWR